MAVRDFLNRLLGRPAAEEGEAELGGRIEVVKASPSWLDASAAPPEQPAGRPAPAPPSAE